MVDVLIDEVTALELVGLAAFAVVVDHALGLARLLVHQHLAMGIGGYGCRLALGQHIVDVGLIFAGRQSVLLAVVLQVVVTVLVDTLGAETVDGTEGGTDGHALYIATAAGGFPLGIERVEHGLVHLRQLVGILCHIEAGAHGEFALLHDVTEVEVQLPSLILHRTNVGISQGGETGHGGDPQRGHQQVGGLLVIVVEVYLYLVLEQTDVEAQVVAFGLLHIQVIQFHAVERGYGHPAGGGTIL